MACRAAEYEVPTVPLGNVVVVTCKGAAEAVELVMTKGTLFEVWPFLVRTDTSVCPAWLTLAAETEAWSVVALTQVVVKLLPFQRTTVC